MTVDTVRVIARVTAKAESAAELEAILVRLVGHTRNEAACIRYQLLRDTSDPLEFVTIEEWESDAAIDAHFTTPHLQQALSEATPLLQKDPDIRRYVVIA